MPNWAYTSYVAVGNKDQLNQLHGIMNELECMKSPGLHDNGFGSTWFGNLIIKLGGDWEKVYCRGYWTYLEKREAEVVFDTESAWSELNEVRHFIESKFPDIQLYYQCMEEGMGIYITNDDTGQYFPDRYYLWVEDEDNEYYEKLEDLCKAVENVTGSKHLSNVKACRKALESFSRKNSDCCYTLEEFSIEEN